MLYGIVILYCVIAAIMAWRKAPSSLEVGVLICTAFQTLLYAYDFLCRYADLPMQFIIINSGVRLFIYTFGTFFSALVLLIYTFTVLEAETFNRSHKVTLVFSILFIALGVGEILTFGFKPDSMALTVYLDLACACSTYICFTYTAYFVTTALYRAHMSKQDLSSFDYIMVLGHRLNGNDRHPILELRLDKAFEVWDANGRTQEFILSGGQCFAGTRSEASAMQEYLLAKGVPAEMMILEDTSTTTRENMLRTKETMASRKQDYRCLVVTGDFHLIRGLMNARVAGINAEGVAAHTPLTPLFVGLSTREMMAFFFNRKQQVVSFIMAVFFLEAWRYLLFPLG